MLSFGELMKRAFQTKEIDLIAAGKKIPMRFFKELFSATYAVGQEDRIVENMKLLFIALSGIAGQKLKLKMIDEQEIIMNLSDILSEIYISESLALRVVKLRTMSIAKEKMAIVEKMMQLHIYESLRKVRTAAESEIDSLPEGTKQGLQRKMVKRFAKKYAVNPKDLRRDIADYFIQKNDYTF
ncbi:MAG: hypothetical protein HOL28_05170 [Crocinitomicaceae bacterium]|nr:hypothetical protein [Crocinitomicaceae bacterium]